MEGREQGRQQRDHSSIPPPPIQCRASIAGGKTETVKQFHQKARKTLSLKDKHYIKAEAALLQTAYSPWSPPGLQGVEAENI